MNARIKNIYIYVFSWIRISISFDYSHHWNVINSREFIQSFVNAFLWEPRQKMSQGLRLMVVYSRVFSIVDCSIVFEMCFQQSMRKVRLLRRDSNEKCSPAISIPTFDVPKNNRLLRLDINAVDLPVAKTILLHSRLSGTCGSKNGLKIIRAWMITRASTEITQCIPSLDSSAMVIGTSSHHIQRINLFTL